MSVLGTDNDRTDRFEPGHVITASLDAPNSAEVEKLKRGVLGVRFLAPVPMTSTADSHVVLC